MKFSASGPGGGLAPGLWAYMAAFSLSVYPKALATLPELWAYTAVFSRYTQTSGKNRRIFLKDPDFWTAAHKPSLLCPKSPDFLGIG